MNFYTHVFFRKSSWFAGLRKQIRSVAFMQFLVIRIIKEIHKMRVLAIELLLPPGTVVVVIIGGYDLPCAITLYVNKR